MIRLNLGCGIWLKGGFINVDKFFTEKEIRGKKGVFKGSKIEKNAKFVQADILNLPFKDNYADYVEMHQVIEHFPMRNVINYMKEVYRVMKKGATLVLSTPNFSGVAADWMAMIANPPFNLEQYKDIAEVVYGNQITEGESHHTPFTQDFLNHVLVSAGFTNGKIFIARKGVKVADLKIKYLKPLTKDAVFRNDNLIGEIVK